LDFAGVGMEHATGTNTMVASSLDEQMEIDEKGHKAKNAVHKFTPLDTKGVRFNLAILN